MTSSTPFSEQTQHDKDSGGNAGRDTSKKTGSKPSSPRVPSGLTGRLSYGEKLLARMEGLYASKTVHLAPEPEGGRHGIIGVDGMDMGATQPSPYLKTAILGDSMAAADSAWHCAAYKQACFMGNLRPARGNDEARALP